MLKNMKIFLDEHPHCAWGIVLNTGNIYIRKEHRIKFMPLYTVLQLENEVD